MGGACDGASRDVKGEGEAQLFWEGRYYLHSLLSVVRDLRDVFGIPNLTVPQLPWFAGNYPG
ncbi:hypothetical protein F4677DRAFT_407650 [Hypoxylon crocopeplum]|nr:hypothetical protein F4677DRAFT_407650 [Hypoxylon crocopeplum]